MSTTVQESWKKENNKYQCPTCLKEFTKMGIMTHVWRVHGEGISHKPITVAIQKGTFVSPWNLGKTAETDPRVKSQSEKMKQKIKNGSYKIWDTGKHLSETHRKNISDGMRRKQE